MSLNRRAAVCVIWGVCRTLRIYTPMSFRERIGDCGIRRVERQVGEMSPRALRAIR